MLAPAPDLRASTTLNATAAPAPAPPSANVEDWNAHHVAGHLLAQRAVPVELRHAVEATLDAQAIDGRAVLLLDKDDVLRLFRDFPYGHAVKIWACLHALHTPSGTPPPQLTTSTPATAPVSLSADASTGTKTA